MNIKWNLVVSFLLLGGVLCDPPLHDALILPSSRQEPRVIRRPLDVGYVGTVAFSLHPHRTFELAREAMDHYPPEVVAQGQKIGAGTITLESLIVHVGM